MKKALLAMLLLSLSLTACVVEPGGGGGYRHDDRGDFHSDRGRNGGWNRQVGTD